MYRNRSRLEQTTEYATVPEVAFKALVSEPTTRKYLNELVEEGIGVTQTDGRTTRYKRNEGRRIDERIEELRTTQSHQELMSGIREMKTKIQGFREEYGVESPEDLSIALEPGDDGWGDVGRWRVTRKNLALAKAALQVDEAHQLVEA